MNQVITRPLKEDKDGIEGYIAHPERAEKGPGLLSFISIRVLPDT